MERKFVSPYEIGVYNGLINLILFIISAIIDHYFIKANNYVEYFYNFNSTEVLVILGLMATQLGLYICCFLIDKSFTPCHIFIVFIFGQLVYYLKDIEHSFIVIIICLIIILFFSLVFNEIIELNFCGLSRNTKRNINYRAESEIFESNLLKNQALEEDDDSISIKENAKELNPILSED